MMFAIEFETQIKNGFIEVPLFTNAKSVVQYGSLYSFANAPKAQE